MRRNLVISCILTLPTLPLLIWLLYAGTPPELRRDPFAIGAMIAIPGVVVVLIFVLLLFVLKNAKPPSRATIETVKRDIPRTFAGRLWRWTWVSVFVAGACFIVLTVGTPRTRIERVYERGTLQQRLVPSLELGLACFAAMVIAGIVIPRLPSKPLWTEPGDQPSSSDSAGN